MICDVVSTPRRARVIMRVSPRVSKVKSDGARRGKAIGMDVGLAEGNGKCKSEG